MKVYAVIWTLNCESGVEVIFDSLDKAKNYVEDRKNKSNWCEWEYQEFDLK